MSKNQFFGMLSWMVAPGSLGVELEKVPLIAASRLNGRDDVLRELNGGSIRPNGAETRRFLCTPVALRFGERPAGAVIGARGDVMLALAGVLRRDGIAGGGIDLDGGENVNGLSETSLLHFLEGERKMAGSMFSLSYSSKLEGSNGRLVGENTVFEIEMLDLPPDGDFCAKMPGIVRYGSLR